MDREALVSRTLRRETFRQETFRRETFRREPSGRMPRVVMQANPLPSGRLEVASQTLRPGMVIHHRQARLPTQLLWSVSRRDRPQRPRNLPLAKHLQVHSPSLARQ